MRAILILCSLLVGILGEEVPENQISSVYASPESFSGPWYLLYWGIPDEISLFPPSFQCVRDWAIPINETYVKHVKYIIEDDGSTSSVEEDISINKISNDKIIYTFLIPVKRELTVKMEYYDEYGIAACYVFDSEGKKYLFIYGREANGLEICSNSEKFVEWKKEADDPGKEPYKIEPTKCQCAKY